MGFHAHYSEETTLEFEPFICNICLVSEADFDLINFPWIALFAN